MKQTPIPLPVLPPKKSVVKSAQSVNKELASKNDKSSKKQSAGEISKPKDKTAKLSTPKATKKVTAPAVKPVELSASATTASESEEDSSSEDEETEETSTNSKSASTSDDSGESSEESSDSSGEDDGEDSGSESTESGTSSKESSSEEASIEEIVAQPPVKPRPTITETSKAKSNTVDFRPPPPFRPPHGFEKFNISQRTTNSQLFDSSNSSNKQIWHITAPAGISIAEIKEATLEKMTKGDPVLEYNGAEYAFAVDDNLDYSTTKVMLPGLQGYKTMPSSISKTLHLQQISKVSKITDPSQNLEASSSSLKKTKPIRPQPKGLRMRFKPTGFGDEDPGTLGSSESEDSESIGSQMSRPTKRKHQHSNDTERSAKKHHKEKKSGAHAHLDGSEPNGTNDEINSSQKKKKKHAKTEEGTGLPSNKKEISADAKNKTKKSSKMPDNTGREKTAVSTEQGHDGSKKKKKRKVDGDVA